MKVGVSHYLLMLKTGYGSRLLLTTGETGMQDFNQMRGEQADKPARKPESEFRQIGQLHAQQQAILLGVMDKTKLMQRHWRTHIDNHPLQKKDYAPGYLFGEAHEMQHRQTTAFHTGF